MSLSSDASPGAVPPEPDAELLVHQRSYDVKVYRQGMERLLLRGVVEDLKPAGLLIDDDPDPLPVHQMVVDLVVDLPGMTIVEVSVSMPTTPHGSCTQIEDDYEKLVGLSIARGFSRQVKDLFGGPRGCTHVGALLQAMAPVAIQATWSMGALARQQAGITMEEARRATPVEEQIKFNLNTCHVWDEDGPMVAGVLAGSEIEIPLWAERRLSELGRDPEQWAGS